jgi:phosphohistidine phosphatase SixA
MKKYLSGIAICAFFWTGCVQDKASEVSIEGQYVSRISGDTIFTESGASVIMDSVEKVFYLTRHAEKDTIPADNPLLTEQGLLRSTKLAEILRATRVDAIYSTIFYRSLYTVDSLADVKAMVVLPYETKNLRNVIQQIDSTKNVKSVLFVGHSNTIPSLTNSLAGKTVFNKNWEDNEYDHFIVVMKKTDGSKEVLTLKYKP